ncbi:atrial natriuretic peptide-converting enzyme-like [Mytilus californianus]|uniref:atrial natriuretic peptide-converting enzyme-like n=1 Tax=Mytilus californianus TaxID=6549 RepID=UPI002247083C|nr:atrial natriuretic peptide-converting enzyme-like [Mytilus californianus]XP_052077254.1 atrial natriuretic peptide-converting enzyme-like [Mytilus californianus]
MVLQESMDLSDPAQKRATRKLLIAGLICVFLAVVSIAIVLAVVIQQNEEERIPHGSFDNQHHTTLDPKTEEIDLSSSLLLGLLSSEEISLETVTYSTIIPIATSDNNIDVTSSTLLISSRPFTEIMNSDSSYLTNDKIVSSNDYPKIQLTYSSLYNLPVFSTELVYLTSYSQIENNYFNSDEMTNIKTEIQTSKQIGSIPLTENTSQPFSTSMTEEFKSEDISFDLKSSVTSGTDTTISNVLEIYKSTLKFSDFFPVTLNSNLQQPVLLETSSEELPVWSTKSNTYNLESTKLVLHINNTSGLSTNQMDILPSSSSLISMEHKSVVLTNSTTVQSAASETYVSTSKSSATLTYGNSRWIVSASTLVPYIEPLLTVAQSEFVSSNLEPIKTTAYDNLVPTSTQNETKIENFYSTEWYNSPTQVTVSSTLLPECSTQQFRCRSGQCVDMSSRCDRVIQCEDMSDEFNCANCIGFECGNGFCTWSWIQCNKRVDCMDLSDEIGCEHGSSYRRCDNGLSIPSHKWCDDVDDCFDNSDEINCTCSFGETPCIGGQCIREEWICDGHVDCLQGTDEANCSDCSPDQFVCNDYSCLNITQVCDGSQQCNQAEDEMSCYNLNKDTAMTVQYKGNNYTVCNTHWNSGISDYICQFLGYRNSTITRYIKSSESGNGIDFIELDHQITDFKNILQYMKIRSSCTSNMTVSIACLPRECGEQSPNLMLPFVAGGDIATLGQWPWIVSLSYLGRSFCSGTLISEDWVVTAGHCVAIPGSHNFTENPHYIEVLLGSVKRLRGQGTSRHVDKVIHHPRLTWTGIGPIYYDVALIHLEKSVTYTDYILPACLPKADFSSFSNCYLAGWGYISSNQDITVQDLREAKLHVLSDEECRTNTVPSEQEVNTNITYCAGYKFGVISGCQGDSGSPMMCEDHMGKWKLAGVMSSGAAMCGTFTNTANRFTKLSTMMEWIDYVINV